MLKQALNLSYAAIFSVAPIPNLSLELCIDERVESTGNSEFSIVFVEHEIH